jgi:hypothetical protein
MKVKSTIPQVSQAYFRKLEQQMTASVVRVTHKTGIRGEARAKALIQAEAYDTGSGLRSVTHEVLVSPDKVRLAIFAAAPHMLFVEEGRKPGKWPNLDALTKWVGRKLREQGINTRVNVSFNQLKEMAKSHGKPATAQQKAYRQHLAMLYVVGRAISTRGIKRKLIFKRLEGELLSFFRAELEVALSSLS